MSEVRPSRAHGTPVYSPAPTKRGQRILLVTGTFAPEMKVGALRTERLARTLTEAGHDVTVLAPRIPSDAGAHRPSDVARRVVTVDVGDRYATRMLRFLKRLGLAPAKRDGEGSVGTVTGNNRKPWAAPWSLREFVMALTAVPDLDQNYILPALLKARSWNPGDFDMVYSSAPPFAVHVAAERIAQRLGAPLVLEYRDPWNHEYTERIATRYALTRRVDRWLEHRCIRAARDVVAVSEGAADILRRMPGSPPVHLSLNGIPGALLDEPRSAREGPLTILYAGALYQQRDPEPFLVALSAVVQRRGWSPDRLRLDFLGECRRFNGSSVEELVVRLGLEQHVRFTDRVPHDEAVRALAGADLLLLLVKGQPTQIPNKLYDYLAMRVPIIAYSDPDTEGETARMLNEAGGHLVVTDQDATGQADALETLIAKRMAERNVPVGDTTVLDRWRSERQMNQLLESLSL